MPGQDARTSADPCVWPAARVVAGRLACRISADGRCFAWPASSVASLGDARESTVGFPCAAFGHGLPRNGHAYSCIDGQRLSLRPLEHTFECVACWRHGRMSCRRTSVTVLHRDIGDTFGDLGGTLRRVGGAGEALARSTAPVPKKESVDPRVRLAITQWPPDAPRGAVTTFCAAHGISRKTFYEIRRRSLTDGPAAALEPRSRRPKSSPRSWPMRSSGRRSGSGLHSIGLADGVGRRGVRPP